jgi:chromosome partitioning protein
MIITFAAMKGGVGKTTLAVSIAFALAEQHREARVAILDLNPQGNVSSALGLERAPDAGEYMFNGAARSQVLTSAWIEGGSATRERIAVMRSDHTLRQAERYLALDLSTNQSTIDDVADLIRMVENDAEFVIVDTTDVGLFQEVAIRAADLIVSPVQLEYASMQGLADLSGLMLRVCGSDANLVVVPNMARAHTTLHSEILAMLREQYGDAVLDSIPQRIAFARASAHGLTIFEWRHKGARELRDRVMLLARQITRGEHVAVIADDEPAHAFDVSVQARVHA